VRVLLISLFACLPEPPTVPDPTPAPAPAPVAVQAPVIEYRLPAHDVGSPAATPTDASLDAARAQLLTIVQERTGDPLNPWAIGHGMLVLGEEMKLDNGKLALPWLFEEYAEWVDVGSESLVRFPPSRGEIRIEPHTDLMLKAFMEVGLPLERRFLVQGKPASLEQLYRHSVWRTWSDGKQTNFRNMNDTPWSLQGIATLAPQGLSWTAANGQPTSLDPFTDAVVSDLHSQTQFMREAMSKGEAVEKQRQGIFAYTCGGQHLLQGAAYAVARGFGSEQSRQWVVDEVDVLFWRLDIELAIYDKTIAENPTFAPLLFEQRLKFLGHFLETGHKLAAIGIYTPNEKQAADLARARMELVSTVEKLQELGAFDKLDTYRADPKGYQTYLDFIGDSAHAIRGIDLSTGAVSIRY